MIRPNAMSGTSLAAFGAIALLIIGDAGPAFAESGPADQAAAERLERRREARAGALHLPLPGTPDTETPLSRLRAAGVSLGVRMMIRIFKAESELEVWVEKDGAYIPFATYPVCYWSGMLGPKLREGDRQTPEGFYTITTDQLHYGGRWRRSLNIGFPNAFDLENGRSGSAILIHGGCDSIGCFAMTEAVKNELYDLVSSALRSVARHVPVHVFPFRMSSAAVQSHPTGPWSDFWSDLKQGYDSFARTRLPPRISVCGKRYQIVDASPGDGVDATGVDLCEADAAAARAEVAAAAVAVAAAAALIPVSVSSDAARPAPVIAKRIKLQKGSSHVRRCTMARASCRRWAGLRQQKVARGSAVYAHARKAQKVR